MSQSLKVLVPTRRATVEPDSATSASAVSIAAAVPLGFVIGLSLGALGGGGSILAVPALVYG